MAKVVVACGAHVSDEKTRSCDRRTSDSRMRPSLACARSRTPSGSRCWRSGCCTPDAVGRRTIFWGRVNAIWSALQANVDLEDFDGEVEEDLEEDEE